MGIKLCICEIEPLDFEKLKKTESLSEIFLRNDIGKIKEEDFDKLSINDYMRVISKKVEHTNSFINYNKLSEFMKISRRNLDVEEFNDGYNVYIFCESGCESMEKFTKEEFSPFIERIEETNYMFQTNLKYEKEFQDSECSSYLSIYKGKYSCNYNFLRKLYLLGHLDEEIFTKWRPNSYFYVTD